MSGAAARLDGKEAEGHAAEVDVSGPQEDLEKVRSKTEEILKKMLQRMFAYVLYQVHGPKFHASKDVDKQELMKAIHDCAGCELQSADLVECDQRKEVFEQFGKHRQLINYHGFHGTTWQAALNICAVGVKPERCERAMFGKGFYLATPTDGTKALLYADPDHETITDDSTYPVVVCMVAAPASEDDLPVGGLLTKDGEAVLDAEGIPFANHVLTDEHQTVFCVKDSRAVMQTAILHFSYTLDKPPSDNALLHAWFPHRLWGKLKELYPDTV